MLLRELTNKITVNKVVEFDLGGAIDKMFGTEKPALRPGFVNRRPAGGRARKSIGEIKKLVTEYRKASVAESK